MTTSRRFFAFFTTLFVLLPTLLLAQAQRVGHVEVELLSPQTTVVPGSEVTVGLRILHDEKWHTYWQSTATGLPTEITWELPAGWTAGDIQWPTPQIYAFQGYVEYVYDGEVILPVTLQVPADAPVGETVSLTAKAFWLVCADVCIPGDASLTTTVTLAETASTDPTIAARFRESEAAQPATNAAFDAVAWRDGDTVQLFLPAQTEEPPYFFDAQAFLIPTEAPTAQRVGNGWLLTETVDPAGIGSAERLQGVVAVTGGWAAAEGREGLVIDVTLQSAPPAALAAILNPESTTAAAPPTNLVALMGLAFIGGLILNLMPCVFPVLGIKVMGFVNQAGEAKGKVVAHGLIFTLGVLLSFWALAILLLVLRAGGEELGWGFQLQDPAFVFGLTVFLLLFALNMSGLFEVGQSAVGVGSGLQQKSGLSGSFFSGVLATVVATPCAAPFLAPALGAALTLPALSSMLVFTAIGLGLALPYLTFSAFPSLVKLLPRPGAWMETFKQFMAFLLYATVAFLLWVLVGQLTEEAGYAPFALLFALLSLVVVALAAWAYGRWGAFHRPKNSRRLAYVAAFALLAGGVALGWPRPAFDAEALASSDAPAVVWEKWEPGKAESLAAAGKLVYVDFTARWCVTCQTNKAAVFSSETVRKTFADREIVALKADWTNRDPAITQALSAFGRSAVPFNLLYAPGQDTPQELPELLTPGIVLDALEAVPSGQPMASR